MKHCEEAHSASLRLHTKFILIHGQWISVGTNKNKSERMEAATIISKNPCKRALSSLATTLIRGHKTS